MTPAGLILQRVEQTRIARRRLGVYAELQRRRVVLRDSLEIQHSLMAAEGRENLPYGSLGIRDLRRRWPL